MGRNSTGAVTVGRCLQLNVNAFSKHLQGGKLTATGTINWESGGNLAFSITPKVNGYWLELEYQRTINNEQYPVKYKIQIVGRDSNLGHGTVYHFVCPFKWRYSKILYLGYGSLHFKSRDAYRYRIYYNSQLSSRLDKHNDKWWSIERKLEILKNKHPKSHYRDRLTRPQNRIEQLKEKQLYHEHMRWVILPVAVAKGLNLRPGLSAASRL